MHTPNEVFQAMVDQGLSVVYRRIAVVDSFSWCDSDFDDLLSALKASDSLPTHRTDLCFYNRHS